MARQPYKRQKVAVLETGAPPLIPPTKYEPAPASLRNFPSSIVNGVTAEGGLFSLTFKSVTCATLVENYDLMRRAIFPPEKVELSRIIDHKVDYKDILNNLKTEVEAEKVMTDTDVTPVDELQRQLQVILENDLNLSEFGEKLKQEYEARNPTKVLAFSDKEYTSLTLEIPEVKVDSIDDVKNPHLISQSEKEEPQPGTEKVPIELIPQKETQPVEIVAKADSATEPIVLAVTETVFETATGSLGAEAVSTEAQLVAQETQAVSEAVGNPTTEPEAVQTLHF